MTFSKTKFRRILGLVSLIVELFALVMFMEITQEPLVSFSIPGAIIGIWFVFTYLNKVGMIFNQHLLPINLLALLFFALSLIASNFVPSSGVEIPTVVMILGLIILLGNFIVDIVDIDLAACSL